MPKNIALISKAGIVTELPFLHALKLLRYQEKNSKSDWSIECKTLEFKENEIVRKRSKKDKKSK